jgi:hypothetical protein
VRGALNGPGFVVKDEGAIIGVLRTERVLAGDINGDGLHDLVATTGDGSVFVALGSERGLLPAVQTQLDGSAHGLLLPAIRNLHVADVNGDGRADLIVTDILGRPRAVFYGLEDGGFANTIGGSNGPDSVLG